MDNSLLQEMAYFDKHHKNSPIFKDRYIPFGFSKADVMNIFNAEILADALVKAGVYSECIVETMEGCGYCWQTKMPALLVDGKLKWIQIGDFSEAPNWTSNLFYDIDTHTLHLEDGNCVSDFDIYFAHKLY